MVFFPDDLKHIVILRNEKKADTGDISQYWPITNLFLLLKVSEIFSFTASILSNEHFFLDQRQSANKSFLTNESALWDITSKKFQGWAKNRRSRLAAIFDIAIDSILLKIPFNSAIKNKVFTLIKCFLKAEHNLYSLMASFLTGNQLRKMYPKRRIVGPLLFVQHLLFLHRLSKYCLWTMLFTQMIYQPLWHLNWVCP